MAENIPYDSFIADFYDHSPVVAGRTQDVAFYREAAREFGSPVLELGCGTGRITLALAQAGHRIAGLDLSQRMLDRCAEKLARLPAEVRERVGLVQADMTRFAIGEQFRLVIAPFRPFQHLVEVAQQLDCLARVKQHLAPGGRLILDFFQTDPRRICDPGFLKESAPIAEYEMAGGRRVTLTDRVVAFHYARQCNDVEMIYRVKHPDGREERNVFAFTIRYFFRYEVEHLLARCGFRVAAVYGDFDRSPLTDDSREMIFVAECE
ncbi:MAG TPA: class I SAM-dependent methyltransferase [Methylomirabilota bacterium]|nr:class I SAM-dependent methyltransferase [Methylomirabilota bacterium]